MLCAGLAPEVYKIVPCQHSAFPCSLPSSLSFSLSLFLSLALPLYLRVVILSLEPNNFPGPFVPQAESKKKKVATGRLEKLFSWLGGWLLEEPSPG